MIDTAKLLAHVDLAELVGRFVDLKPDGREYKGLCPFHNERTPSFHVVPEKGFVHCFGCGAHHNAIGFVMQYDGCDFLTACERISGKRLERSERKPIQREVKRDSPYALWIPIMPPVDAPQIIAGVRSEIWNPKRERVWRFFPKRADAYRTADGKLLGYVLRIEFDDGAKVTPQVTWCVGPDGSQRWCSRPFFSPRPLCGLDDLARLPSAPVLMLEGEKCRAAGAGALSMYAAITWPGGSKGIAHVDWSPLAGRDVVLWPDADDAGRSAMLGEVRYDGMSIDGVAQHAARAGCRSLRMVDTQGMPKGWDIADAIEEGWSPRQIATWAAARVKDVEVVFEGGRKAA